jgi:CHAD domain-containing protein
MKHWRMRLTPHVTVCQLGAAALAEAYSQLIANAPGALAKQEPEAIHRARIGLRKLRIYVRLFRSRIGRKRAEKTGRELRRVFRLLGELRDLQVFARDVLPYATGPKAEAAAFRRRIDRRTAAARKALRSIAETKRFNDLCNALHKIARDLSQRRDHDRARAWLTKRLSKQRARLVVRTHDLLAESADLHRMRKHAKKLRYTTELVCAPSRRHAKRERKFQAALKGLQDNLGALNDAHVARALIVRERAPALLRERLSQRLDAQEEAHRADLPTVYAHFALVDPFWD